MASPGIELLFGSVKNDIKSPADIIVCVLHWELVTNNYKCVGLGETEGAGATKKTEMLPGGWNESQDLYALRYQATGLGQNYILKVLRMEDTLLVHFMSAKDEKVVSINVRISDYVTEDMSSLDNALKSEEKLSKLFRKDIIDQIQGGKFSPKAGTSGKRQKERTQPDDDDPLRVRPQHPPQRGYPPEWADPDDPFAVGRGDLDPLGRGPGGMVFDPMRSGPRFRPDHDAGLPGRLPRGAVPPGARFDPFGPPGQGPGPSPDHMKPPGFDDMFM